MSELERVNYITEAINHLYGVGVMTDSDFILFDRTVDNMLSLLAQDVSVVFVLNKVESILFKQVCK